MRTSRRAARSTSSDKVSLTCPVRWDQLSQEQLRYVLQLIGSGLYSDVEVRTYMLFRFCGIGVIGRSPQGGWKCWMGSGRSRRYFDLQEYQVRDMIGQLGFVSRPEEMNVRLESIQGCRPVDGLLHNLPFIDYLNLETAYQGYLQTRDTGRVRAMARILYRDAGGSIPDAIELDVAEETGVLFWYYYIKEQLSRYFPNFFRPVSGGSAPDGLKLLEAVNAQIRALTDGDITKESAVKHADCWRALTELDAKAREANEFKAKYGNK